MRNSECAIRHHSARSHVPTFVLTVALLAACQSQQQTVESMKPQAVATAQKKGSFDMNCPNATANVLSNEMIQQRENYGPLQGAPPERAEYTVGVEGCGKRSTYTVICAQGGTGCFAANPQGNTPTQTTPQ